MVRLLVPSDDCYQMSLSSDYQILIDSCIRVSKCSRDAIKLISRLPEVTDFNLVEWIYVANRLKFRSIWIVPAWTRYTVRPKFLINCWAPCDNKLSIYVITNKFLIKKIKYWTSDLESALRFLDFAGEYGEFYHAYKMVRKDSCSYWEVQKSYRNYRTQDIVAKAMMI